LHDEARSDRACVTSEAVRAARAARRGAAACTRRRPLFELLPEVTQARSDLAFVVQLDDIRYRKWVWISEPGGRGYYNTRIAPPEYRVAFANARLT